MQPCRTRAALLLLGLLACAPLAGAPAPGPDEPSPYRQLTPSRDGTGKVYMGREIARVMGHRGAAWLERPAREREERTDLLLQSLAPEPDDVIVDLGAGTGYFTLALAPRVPAGRVLAVDIQPEMLEIVERRVADKGLDNVRTVLASETDPHLPAGEADAVLMVDAYHEFSHPREVMTAVVAALAPGGRVYLVEYRGEDPSVPIRPLHKMTERQAVREMQAVGLEWVETRNFLPWQHVLIFRKPPLH